MKSILTAFLLFAGVCASHAQPTLTITGPSSPVRPGSTVNLTVSLAGSGTANLASLQAVIAGAASGTTANVGAAAAAASKSVASAVQSTNLVLIVYGMNQNILADGPVAQLQFSLAPITSGNADGQQIQQQVSGLVAANAAASSAPISAGAPFTLNVLSACDLNSDGVVDIKDALLMVAQIEAMGGTPTPGYDLNGDGVVNVIDLQRIANAAGTGGHCRVGP